jgi:pyruvate,water dikinase
VLTDAQILGLADMGRRVEAHFGTPQDIEWAIVADQVYLLQSRPITSLYPIDGLQSPDDSLHIYFSGGHQQMMTNAMAPLSLSSIKVLIPVGHGQNEIESVHVGTPGGRLYLDVTQPLRHPILRKVIFGMLAQFDALAPQTLQMAMQRPEFQRPPDISLSLAMIRGIVGLVYQIMYALWWKDLSGSVRFVDGLVAQQIKDVETKLSETPVGKERIQAILQILPSLLFVVLRWAPLFAAGEAAKRFLVRLGRGWADPADLEAVSLGLAGNVVTDMNLAVGDLADTARQSPQLVTFFEQLGDDSQVWLAQAAKLQGSALFFQAWERFLADYGARGPSEIDIQARRWYEEPLPLLQVIASYLQKEAGNHRVQHQKLAAARETAVSKLLTHANHGIGGWLRKKVVKRLIHVIHHGGVLREHHKFMLIQNLRTIKEALQETAVHLTHTQKLTHPDDIWYLTWPELLAIWDEEGKRFAEQIPSRRADLVRFQKLTPPMVITSDGEIPIVQYHVADAPPDALVGNPVSSGVVEGMVRVIHDPQTETLNPGEILVAPFTDPGWTPLFINANGLILEVGGNLTHGSVVAREYGIPAVVGVREATKTLQTGQWVRIDGNRGIIEIL